MIHSLCGGELSSHEGHTFVKVMPDAPYDTRPWFYLADGFRLVAGDRVRIPYGKSGTPVAATVLRVDENVSDQAPPVPLGRAQSILGKL